MSGVKTEVTPAVKRGMIEDLDPFTISDEFAMIKQPQAQNPPPAMIRQPAASERQRDEHGEPEALPQSRPSLKPSELPESQISSPGAIETPGTTEIPALAMGFRIHIGIFDKESEAKEFARTTESKIDEKVYIVYEAPFFKVRVGDFTSLKDAEEYVKYLKSIGFKSSWWLRTTINTQ